MLGLDYLEKSAITFTSLQINKHYERRRDHC